ncbi:hypothetical protein [Chroogloeocystis siderophila]|jgi:hypothetical protein|uniref:vWA-MoxR associated protein N-terminal HTH domain-containing protein n=1 Tax=Chroogloeocystis siderophila 5.2 s.c.1 TaxID=247279 RepID=A0A1U7HRU8_9CHRO|nr:hypothetical protein [Chroogloeocystis siderophila]OKH26301.1 hypothetical protein NIES1031_11035 [Chroogloeocystis siderophila 5.2 s.c.1]
MDIEQALLVVDAALENISLNNVQELVLRQSWEGKTYPEIAESYGYEANYIKNVGYKLWILLSQAFAENVTKSNFRSVIRRQSIRVLAEQCSTVAADSNSKNNQNTTDVLKRTFFETKLAHYDTNSTTLNQHLVAINMLKQCSECSLIVLSAPSKNAKR